MNLYLIFKCWSLKYKALNQICENYFVKNYIGLSCTKFCDERSLELIDCPNILYHKGKDYVFEIEDQDQNRFILKSRDLHLSTKDFTKDQLILSIVQLVKETFKDALDVYKIKNLIYLDETDNRSINLNNLNDLDFVTLTTIYNLLQDNEFLLSMVLNDEMFKQYKKILPSINRKLSNCGHWYIVDKVDTIIDYSYLDQSKHDSKTKLFIALKLIDFLINFESLNIDLELCDTKYEHFGFFKSIHHQNSNDLVLIDSDMIYHHRNVKENIKAIQNCKTNDDCDFIDCKGKCDRLNGTSNCDLDKMDSNLKRICHLYFVEPFNDFSSIFNSKSLGLLANLEKNLESDIRSIYDLCFKDDLIDSKTNEVYLLKQRVQMIRTILSQIMLHM